MIYVYEDEGWSGLDPLCDLRPVFDLRCGRLTLLEKLRRRYPREVCSLWVRDELAAVSAEAHPDCTVNRPPAGGRLFFSGRAILDEHIAPLGREAVLMAGDEVVGFRVCTDCAVRISSLAGLSATLAVEQVKARVVRHPWDVVDFNAGELERELGRRHGPAGGGPKSRAGTRRATLPRGVELVGPPGRLAIARGARVWPGAVISTETGPVLIERRASVRPGSLVEGPCWVGPGTVIDGAKVRPGCSLGPDCRVGGEIEASVFQGRSNKHHHGFIGHAFVGEWVNLGAGTTNSDLKNAYGSVRVRIDGRDVDTGRLKVGCFVGDHAKTAIGTLLNTGTVVGSFANWFEPGLSPRSIPRFARGASARESLAAVLATARTMMARRGVSPSAAWAQLVARLYRRRFRA
ncbi:MAG: putative sugar nucleotidyl transferase [bacterium]